MTVGSDELRVKSEELWYAFLTKSFYKKEKNMQPFNKNIALQCKPTSSIFHLPSSIPADLTGGLL
jgi:hypothetical protein